MHLFFCKNLPKNKLAPPFFHKSPAKGEGSGVAKKLEELAYTARPLALLKQVRINRIQWFLLGLQRADFWKGHGCAVLK
jgi:hypothetical protein